MDLRINQHMNQRAEPPPQFFPALWFDGRRAQAVDVELSVKGGGLLLRWPETGVFREYRLRKTRISQRLEAAPRLFWLPDGSALQVAESPALAGALSASGFRPGQVEEWERNWKGAVIALILLLLCSIYVYKVALPAGARWAAEQIPHSFEVKMGDQVLKSLDRKTLLPSELDQKTRDDIEARFNRMAQAAAPEAQARLLFRKAATGDGINAFTLPGGTIVLLDGLVKFAKGDREEIMGVLAHELGHAHHRHMTRGVFQALGGGALAGLIWGDYSSVAGNAATVVGVLKYSRDNETEADDFAYDTLKKTGYPPGPIAQFFKKITVKYQGKVPTWLSTHPAPEDRAARAKREEESEKAKEEGKDAISIVHPDEVSIEDKSGDDKKEDDEEDEEPKGKRGDRNK
jgi:predicted Zn-dependent protease